VPPAIRATALALIVDGERLLVSEGFDDVKGERFYRLLGGGIEFGEAGAEAVAREVGEEIGARIASVEYLATLENIFIYLGAPGHEIARVYAVALADPGAYAGDEVPRRDETKAERTLWMPLGAFFSGAERLYPDGVVDVLEAEWRRRGADESGIQPDDG
jgi:ADP-ribose pyrophosphatase YjhB (NUDIX family)